VTKGSSLIGEMKKSRNRLEEGAMEDWNSQEEEAAEGKD
jgi:hypothetical protein